MSGDRANGSDDAVVIKMLQALWPHCTPLERILNRASGKNVARGGRICAVGCEDIQVLITDFVQEHWE